MSQKIKIFITDENANMRLDQVLSTLESVESRSQAQKIIKEKKVLLNGKAVKSSRLTVEGEEYEVSLPEKSTGMLKPVQGDLNIIFEDDYLIVIDKPAGIVVHPSHGHQEDSLVNVLLGNGKKLAKGSDPSRPGVVHRLDKDTSGLMIFAKADEAYDFFVEEFKNKKVKRIYQAICFGKPKEDEFKVESYLSRHPKNRKKHSSSKDQEGRLAISHFKVLQNIKNKFSLLECELETGRTHQIRVHLSENHFPILGDEMYGNKNTKIKGLSRQALHSCELSFTHPVTKEVLIFKSDLPDDLKKLLE
ncbi:RluA family pseudouridine synthase [bacterium]|nr:RluA family pseudouridine synthase [bacterium]